MINYTKHSTGSAERDHVLEAYDSGYLIGGDMVPAFESEFANRVSVTHACAVSSGTAALHLCVEAVKRKYGTSGGKVVTTPLTFAASVSALNQGGFRDYRFADIDPRTLNVDLDAVESILRAAKRDEYSGIMVVHFAGTLVPMADVASIAERYGLWVIEDAAHALGSDFSGAGGDAGSPCGSAEHSDCAAFSFHPAKTITTGEGGMVTTRDASIDAYVRAARSHCMNRSGQHRAWEYDVLELGFNYRMTEMQAAIGRVQLSRLDAFVQNRRKAAKRYDLAFEELEGITIPYRETAPFHARNLYIVEVEDRDALHSFLHRRGINCQVLYKPLHLMTFYSGPEIELPSVERYFARCLALPLFPDLSITEQDLVIDHVRDWFRDRGAA